MVDAKGDAATFTGKNCFSWAGGKTGKHYAAQGNILTGPETVEAMARAYEASRGELPDRLVTALEAGQAAGGDRRGRESAALLVVRKGAGYGGKGDRWVDLRVDDHPDPVKELRRLLGVHHLYFGRTDRSKVHKIDEPLARELQRVLRATPYTKKVMVNVHPTVAAMLYNEERAHVAALEQTWHMTLAIQGDNDMPHGHFEVLSL